MLTPLTSFPRCTLLFHGLGKRGGMGQGQTGRRQQQAPVEIMGGVGLSWLGGWWAPGAPSL